jgi:3-carboxy-cis,cis-muconate cycloisomerase
VPPSSSTPEADTLFAPVLAHGGVRAVTGDRAWLQAMLDVEAALAHASADCGLLDRREAEAIAAACDADAFDAAEIGQRAVASGNPVVPLVRALTAAVEGEGAAHVHRGATSQDVLDTALMLVTRNALDVIIGDLSTAADAAADLARATRDLPTAARTLLQQAVPTTFGCRAAGWMTGLDTATARLRHVRRSGLPAQLGGAAGTLASLGRAGPDVADAFARRLDLVAPVLPWHTVRTPIADLAGALGAAAGVCGKIARDVVLLAQTEVGEVSEGVEGRGGSSTMPHKRNPVAAVAVVAAATDAPALVATLLAAMAHEQERAAGAWHAEWRPCIDLLRSTGSAAAWLRDCLTHLQVHPDRMRSNLDLTGGLLLAERVTTALTPRLGRLTAHDLVQAAADRARDPQTTLYEQLRATPEVAAACPPAELRRLLDPSDATGNAATLVDRALARHDRQAGR